MMVTLFVLTFQSREHTWLEKSGPDQAGTLLISEGADAAFAMQGLSTARPMTCNPLSTYITVPVIAEARGEARKAAVFPTLSASTGHQRVASVQSYGL